MVALCLGFDWPSRLDHYAYEFRHGSSEDKRSLLIQIAKEPSKEATELLLRALEDVDDSVRLFALNALGTRHVDAGLSLVRDLPRCQAQYAHWMMRTVMYAPLPRAAWRGWANKPLPPPCSLS